MWFHPLYIVNEPFILDFRGEWPTDCHPGEQKPVITEYTGDSVLIEFEIIVEHPVCNDTPTAYRVLVGMSDVIIGMPPPGNASYVVRDIEGEIVAEMRCEYQTTMVCELDSDDNPDGYAVRLLSPERIILTSLSPISMGKIGAGTAVRID